MFWNRKCDCSERLKALEDRVAVLESGKQDKKMNMGLKRDYPDPRPYLSMYYTMADVKDHFKYIEVQDAVVALLKHCHLDVNYTPGKPEHVEIVPAQRKKP